jgi:N-acylneuraminate cytidylyltransferase/CMP-N,N'-diacetyllegionaminic acid synthase
MEVLGIIPARGGSKRVPGKNIRPLAGKPLIAYTIEASLSAGSINRLIVSTDDNEIANISKQHGAEVPFLRPSELADDATPDQPVFVHTLQWLKDNDNYEPDAIVHLRPTTPLKSPQTIDNVVQKMIDTNADVVRTMTLVEGVHHPYWMYSISDEGRAVPFVKDIEVSKYYQRQLLPEVYRINGVVDAIKTHVVLEGNVLDSQNMAVVTVSGPEAIDIDTESDFMMCEYLLKSGIDLTG